MIDYYNAANNYTKAIGEGCCKSTLKDGHFHHAELLRFANFRSSRPEKEFVEHYFTGTPSRIGGVGIEEISREAGMRHEAAFPRPAGNRPHPGCRRPLSMAEDGEDHLFNPETIYKLQLACRNNDYKVFQQYAGLINNQSEDLGTLRGLLDFKYARTTDSAGRSGTG